MANQILNTGIYLSLLAQLDKLARHNRQGSFRTKERYYEAMKRFCAFLADAFRLQKLSNINGKHLTAYILKLQDDGKAPSTIKTDLAAIRFFHDLMDAKYKLPDNEELKVALQRRTFGGVDRTWSREEFSRMLAEALRLGREDYVTILYLARMRACASMSASGSTRPSRPKRSGRGPSPSRAKAASSGRSRCILCW